TAVESWSTRSSISSCTSGGGGIDRQLATTLRRRRASMSRARPCDVCVPVTRQSIVRSSVRSRDAKDDVAPFAPFAPLAALGTGWSPLGIALALLVFTLAARNDAEHGHHHDGFDLAGREEPIVEEEAPRRREHHADCDGRTEADADHRSVRRI